MPAPNILVVMTDQQKATAIRLYSDLGVPTPSLERLAARGVRFESCYTPHPLCVPARVSFWTGRYPHQHGSRTNELPMQPGQDHLATTLRQAGYRLALFGKNHCFPPAEEAALFDDRFVFSHGGPDASADEREAEVVAWIRAAGPRPPGTHFAGARVNPFPAEACPTAVLARHVVRFLERRDDARPFCAWVSIPDPHPPLQCPEPYASMHPPDSVRLPPRRDGDLAGKMERLRVFRDLLGYDRIDEAAIRQRVSLYYGMIRFLDDAIGQMLDALERAGLADDTVVVFTADHGDYAGEHGLTDKSSTLLDPMTRVPLILSWPGHLPDGAVEPAPVSLLDVLPTCLTLAGVAPPPGVEGRPLPSAGGAPRDAVFAEYGAGGPRLHHADAMHLREGPWQRDTPAIPLLRWREAEGRPKMVRMGRHKYVYDPMDEVDELYDLESDPWELTNLAADPAHAGERARLRDRLLAWSIETEGGAPSPLYFDRETGLNSASAFYP